MKSLFAPVLLAGVLLFSFQLVSERTASAQPPQAQRWEYRVFRLDPQDYADKQDYQQILKREGPRRVEAAFQEHVLKYLGKDGWELISIERRSKNLVYLYLKRPGGF